MASNTTAATPGHSKHHSAVLRPTLVTYIHNRILIYFCSAFCLQLLYALGLWIYRGRRILHGQKIETPDTCIRRVLRLHCHGDGLFAVQEFGRSINAVVNLLNLIFCLGPMLLISSTCICGYILAEFEGWSTESGPVWMAYAVSFTANQLSSAKIDTTAGKWIGLLCAVYCFVVVNTILGLTGLSRGVEMLSGKIPAGKRFFFFVVLGLLAPVSIYLFSFLMAVLIAVLNASPIPTVWVNLLDWVVTGGNMGFHEVSVAKLPERAVWMHLCVAMWTLIYSGVLLGIVGSHNECFEFMQLLEGSWTAENDTGKLLRKQRDGSFTTNLIFDTVASEDFKPVNSMQSLGQMLSSTSSARSDLLTTYEQQASMYGARTVPMPEEPPAYLFQDNEASMNQLTSSNYAEIALKRGFELAESARKHEELQDELQQALDRVDQKQAKIVELERQLEDLGEQLLETQHHLADAEACVAEELMKSQRLNSVPSEDIRAPIMDSGDVKTKQGQDSDNRLRQISGGDGEFDKDTENPRTGAEIKRSERALRRERDSLRVELDEMRGRLRCLELEANSKQRCLEMVKTDSTKLVESSARSEQTRGGSRNSTPRWGGSRDSTPREPKVSETGAAQTENAQDAAKKAEEMLVDVRKELEEANALIASQMKELVNLRVTSHRSAAFRQKEKPCGFTFRECTA